MLRHIVFCIWCIVSSMSAQEPAFLKGRVVDRETGEGVAGAIVAIKEMWPSIGVVSDTAGNYMLSIYPISKHTIAAFHPYYETTAVRCTFVRPDTWDIDFPLNRRTTIDEEYGVITGIVTESENHEPLYMADVLIWGTELGAGTLGNGRYVINNVPVGTHILYAACIAHDPITDSAFQVLPGTVTVRNFELRPMAPPPRSIK